MKKTKKVLASLAIAGMVATTVPFNALADTSATRIFGSDRIQTAIQVAQAGWATGAATVIVAPAADANLVDALAAAPLAGQDNAPILLTAGSALDPNTKQEIMNLKATKVIAVGALSDQVINDLKAISGLTVQQLKGTDRIDTASKIAGQLTAPAGTFVVGYGALPDALSVASYAAANDYEILVANPDGSLPSSEVPVGTKYVIGGPTLVNDGAVPGATRIAGQDRYETNSDVIQKLGSNFGTVFVANGENAHLVDSLVASAYAAKTNSVIALTDNNTVEANNFLGQKMTDSSNTIALGGPGVVSETIRTSVGSTTPAPTSTAGITSVNMSSGGSVATNQALVTIGSITVNGGSQGASITGIDLTRSGLSADTTISSITIWNGATRLNVPNILSNGDANITFTNPLSLTAGQSATLAIKVNISSTAVSGAQFAFTVNSLQGAAASTLLPATSGTMTVSNVALGTLTDVSSGDAPTGNLDAGTTDQRLAKFDFTANTEDQLLKQVTFTQESSIGDTDLANLKLYNNGTQVGATATMLNRKVTFTFGDGLLITSGSTVRLELRGDVVGGSGRQIDFDINDANDVQSVGKTYGTTIVGEAATGSTLTVNAGSFLVSKDSTSPAAGTIAGVVKGQLFSNISVQAVGEPIQLQKVLVSMTPAGGAALTNLTNLKLVTSDGTVIGQVTNPTFTGGAEPVTLTSPITITPGTPTVIGIEADIPTSAAATSGYSYILGIAPQTIIAGTTYDSMVGVGNVSGITRTIDVTSAVTGNIMTVGDIKVTATPVAQSNQSLFQGGANSQLVSYDLTQNMSEDVSISQIVVNTTVSGGATMAGLANMKIVDPTTGNVLSNTIAQPSAAQAFTFNTPIVVKPNQTVRVTLAADVLSSAPTGTYNFDMEGTAHTVALGTTVNFPDVASTTDYKVTAGGATVVASVSANANLDADINAARSAKDVKVAAFKLDNSPDGDVTFGPEDAIVKTIFLKPTGTMGAQYVSNVRIVNYSDPTKIYATLSQLPAAGQAIDLATPITVGSSSSNHSMDFLVLADISSTAPYAGTYGIQLGGAAGSTDDLKYQGATTGVTKEDNVTLGTGFTVAAATTAHVTETVINVVAASVSNPVTSSTAPYPANLGSTLAKFTLTNNGSTSVLLNQVELTDTLGTMDASTANVTIYRTSTGADLSGDVAWVAGTHQYTLTTPLRLDPGKSESISVRIGATAGDAGTLEAGNAVAISMTKAGTQYKDLSGAPTGFSVDDDNVTSDVVTFTHN